MCDVLSTILCSGAIGALVVCSMLLSFKILKFPDLTGDGSYSLGCVSYSFLAVSGLNPILCIIISIAIGMTCGFITAWLYHNLKIPKMMCGVITLVATIGLVQKFPVVQYSQIMDLYITKLTLVNTILVLGIILPILFVMYKLMSSEFGLRLRALSENKTFTGVHSLSRRTELMVGLVLSNGMIALAGALSNQVYSTHALFSGFGTFLFAVSAILVGERFFFRSASSTNLMIIVAIGAIYRIILALASCMMGLNTDNSFMCVFSSLVLAFVYAVISHRRSCPNKAGDCGIITNR